jgi:hypothetical protein
MKAKIYLFLGQGGSTLSWGFTAYGRELATMGYEVQQYEDSGRDTTAVFRDVKAQPVDRPVVFFGYSLGGNGAAWCADVLLKYRPERKIDLLIGWDPTVLASLWGAPLANYPIGSNVQRCLCFRNTMWFGTGMFGFGHGIYARRADGPAIHVTDVWNDHLYVQSNPRLQQIATNELQRIK